MATSALSPMSAPIGNRKSIVLETIEDLRRDSSRRLSVLALRAGDGGKGALQNLSLLDFCKQTVAVPLFVDLCRSTAGWAASMKICLISFVLTSDPNVFSHNERRFLNHAGQIVLGFR
uniref:Uncharacterized protein n=1 Tax=Plectus sambesii TaxID=2011161 RepID=A0A914VIU5_9BILA